MDKTAGKTFSHLPGQLGRVYALLHESRAFREAWDDYEIALKARIALEAKGADPAVIAEYDRTLAELGEEIMKYAEGTTRDDESQAGPGGIKDDKPDQGA